MKPFYFIAKRFDSFHFIDFKYINLFIEFFYCDFLLNDFVFRIGNLFLLLFNLFLLFTFWILRIFIKDCLKIILISLSLTANDFLKFFNEFYLLFVFRLNLINHLLKFFFNIGFCLLYQVIFRMTIDMVLNTVFTTELTMLITVLYQPLIFMLLTGK